MNKWSKNVTSFSSALLNCFGVFALSECDYEIRILMLLVKWVASQVGLG